MTGGQGAGVGEGRARHDRVGSDVEVVGRRADDVDIRLRVAGRGNGEGCRYLRYYQLHVAETCLRQRVDLVGGEGAAHSDGRRAETVDGVLHCLRRAVADSKQQDDRCYTNQHAKQCQHGAELVARDAVQRRQDHFKEAHAASSPSLTLTIR